MNAPNHAPNPKSRARSAARPAAVQALYQQHMENTPLARLLDAGTIRVAIDSTFQLADARKAHERALGGHLQGKIVMTVA